MAQRTESFRLSAKPTWGFAGCETREGAERLRFRATTTALGHFRRIPMQKSAPRRTGTSIPRTQRTAQPSTEGQAAPRFPFGTAANATPPHPAAATGTLVRGAAPPLRPPPSLRSKAQKAGAQLKLLARPISTPGALPLSQRFGKGGSSSIELPFVEHLAFRDGNHRNPLR